jgi:hypothetical protein
MPANICGWRNGCQEVDSEPRYSHSIRDSIIMIIIIIINNSIIIIATRQYMVAASVSIIVIIIIVIIIIVISAALQRLLLDIPKALQALLCFKAITISTVKSIL